MIKRTKIDLSDEKKLLTNMIVSSEFLKKVQPIVSPKLMEASYSKTLVTWILEFFDYTKEAPGRAIQDIFQSKAKLLQNDETRDSIAEYLTHLSSQWEQAQINNVEYSYKSALEYLRLRQVDYLINQLQAAKSSHNPEQCESLIAQFSRLERPEGTAIDLMNDARIIKESLTQTDERLFKMPGDLGTAIGWICREDFIAISAPPKRGKSWYMMEAGFRAALAGKKVLFVSLEMTKEQTVRRWWSAFNAKPLEGGVYKVPKFEPDGNDGFDILYEDRKVDGLPTDIASIEKKQRQYNMALGDGEVRLEIFPSGQMTLSMLEDELDKLEFYENFVPDVLIVDYADILKPETKGEKRHQLDDIWLRMRGIAQRRKVALITGSQTGRETTKKDAGADSFAEHFGKAAHITKGIFLNQTKEEKGLNLIRIDCETQREGKTFTEQVVVLQGLDIGRPYLDSKFIGKINMPTRAGGYGI